MASFEVAVGIRWGDLDAQGHVNNAVVGDYLQQARVGVLLNGPLAAMLTTGIVIVSHSIDYLAPIDYEAEPLAVRVRIGDVRGASFSYDYALSQRGRPVARARSLACAFDFDAAMPRRFEPAERDWLAEVAEPLEPRPPLGPFAIGERVHHHPLEVRWSDLDSYGHVNNVAFLTYLGEARVALNTALNPENLAPGKASGTVLIARQDVAYLAQLPHRLAPYDVASAIARVGRTSVTFAHEIVDPGSGVVFARAGVVLVYADAAGRPCPVPQGVVDAAARWPAEVGR